MSHMSRGEKEEDKTGDFHKNDGGYVSVYIDFISMMKNQKYQPVHRNYSDQSFL